MKKLYLIGVLFLFMIQTLNSQWISNFGGINTGDDPLTNAKGLSITVDGGGKCYMAGYNYSMQTDNDILLIKYNENGDTEWVRTYDGGYNGDDKAYGIAIDNSGNIYVVGAVNIPGLSYEVIVLKYSNDGTLQWFSRTGETQDLKEDRGLAIAVSQDGYIYVTGYTTGADGYTNILLKKYDPTGVPLWFAYPDGNEHLDSKAYGIVVDELDNIYITGYTNSASKSNDIITIKCNNNGEIQWSKTYNGPGNGDDQACNIALDQNNDVYVTGYITNYFDNIDIALLKYSNDGTLAWFKNQNGNAFGEDKAYGIVVDELDQVVLITGYVTSIFSGKDYATLCYDLQGNKLWGKTYNGPVSGTDIANAVGVMNDGRVIVTGKSKGVNGDYDFATIKYSKYGSLLQTSRYSMTGNSNDIANDIAISDDNSVFITGSSELILNSLNAPSYATTLSLEWGVPELENTKSPIQYVLSQNYPNPFNPSTNINFTIGKDARVKINIYDILGRLVQTITDEDLVAGTYKVTFDGHNLSSGTYFYELTAGDFRDVKKMILIK